MMTIRESAKVLGWYVVGIFCGMFIAVHAAGQTTKASGEGLTTTPSVVPAPHAIRLGIVSGEAVPMLGSAFVPHASKESAYCVTLAWRVPYPEPRLGDSIYRVMKVEPAQMDSAGQGWAMFNCPAGLPILHTHPYDGNDMPNCSPSKPDYEIVEEQNRPFGIVQCDRYTFIFYFPRH